MDDYRTDPDALLAAIQKEDSRQKQGKLKIFFGMVAGVGKTYAMLQAAQQAQQAGIDVVVGYVETHRRAETEALLAGLEIIPRQRLEYRGTWLEEMDIDAILTRHPTLVLVDELAHTNAIGARHRKRYQDVLELLEAGIDVWTTVNVQHFESRVDAVAQITGITVHETVPDSLLDRADEIELIDLSPEELRKRLNEGKVYSEERVATATNNFFRLGNLNALREMALRLTAEHVDQRLQAYMQVKQISGPWKSTERLMVAVGPSPFSEQLIRWTRRMAYNLEAEWLAVTIETSQGMDEVAKERLGNNLALARSLGAEVVMAAGDNISAALLRIAHQRNVTQIVVGKPLHSRWHDLLRGALVDNLVRQSGDIDIYVVTGDTTKPRPRMPLFPQDWFHSGITSYLNAVFIVGLVTLIDLLLFNRLAWVSYQAVGLTELFTVLLVAVYLGRGPAILAATLSAISWNFLFIHPRFTFVISQLQDLILFMLYFVIAVVAGNLTARIRMQEQQTRHNAERTMALYHLAHETATAVNMEDVLQTAITQMSQVFNAEIVVFLSHDDQLAHQPHPASTLAVAEKEYSVAQWVYDHGKPAGRHTNTLPLAAAQYRPLLTPNHTVGVVGVAWREERRLSFDEEVLLETFINQVALGIERELLDEAAEQAAMLQESERLYSTLLNSISHELRTPIATIAGASSSLLDPQTNAQEEVRLELMQDIQGAANRLNRLVENLLDMSRLDAERLRLKSDWCDLADIIGVAVKRLENELTSHPLTLKITPDLPLVKVDFVLIEQVLVNLLDNACNYTPTGTAIEISAHPTDNAHAIEISVTDAGAGVPADDLERIFDKFYRVPGTATGGTGLGLSISRGLIEAHGGTLRAENIPHGGAKMLIRLPIIETPPPVKEATL